MRRARVVTSQEGPADRGGRVPTPPRARRPRATQHVVTAAVSGGRKQRPAKRARPPSGPPEAPAITDAEFEAILLAIVRGTRRLGQQELLGRAQRVAAWATRIRIGAAALELVMAGRLDVVVPAQRDAALGFVRRGGNATPRSHGGSVPVRASTPPATSRASRRTGAA